MKGTPVCVGSGSVDAAEWRHDRQNKSVANRGNVIQCVMCWSRKMRLFVVVAVAGLVAVAVWLLLPETSTQKQTHNR